MNIFNLHKNFLFFTVIFVLFLGSCKKKSEDAPLPDPDLGIEREVSLTEADLNSIYRDIHIYEFKDSTAFLINPTTIYSYKLKKDSLVGTYINCMTLTYKGKGVDSLDRSGIVKCFFSGWKSKGTYRDSIGFENVTIAARNIKGGITSKQVFFPAYNRMFSVEAQISTENIKGIQIQYSSSKLRTRTNVSTTNELDDVWAVSGSWSGTVGTGEKISVQTASPLIIQSSCSVRHFNKGVAEIKNNSTGISRRIKYGDGKCTAWAGFINEKGIEYLFLID